VHAQLTVNSNEQFQKSVLTEDMGHPFMTPTRRGKDQAQVDACGRKGGGQLHVDVHTQNF